MKFAHFLLSRVIDLDAIFSLENESFKLRVSPDHTEHNFIPKTRKIQLSACRASSAAFQVILMCESTAAINVGRQPWFSEFEDTCNIRLEHVGVLSAQMHHVDLIGDDRSVLYGDAFEPAGRRI